MQDSKILALSEKIGVSVGELSSIIWPFQFNFNRVDLSLGNSARASFTITQEAGFLLMEINASLMMKRGAVAPHTFEYMNRDFDGLDVTMQLRDAQSSRQYMDTSICFANLGNAARPTQIPTPLLIPPSSSIEALFSCTTSVAPVVDFQSYIPQVTCYGYRVRSEELYNLLSTITQ
jgi:hypothetical protein